VLSALRAAHAAGIQHRDVKPGNVLLRPDGTPVLTDFGIAALQESPGLTATGMLIGSPEYMAPERIHGREGDPASDLWSLGLLLYVGLEGYNPLRRDTTIATIAAVAEGNVPPPTRSGPMAQVLGAMLVKDPARRVGADQLDWMLAEVERGVAASGLASSMPSGAPASSMASTPPAWPTGDQRQPAWPQTAQFEASGGTAPNQRPNNGTHPVANPYDGRTDQIKAKQPVARYVASGMAAVVMSGGMVWMIHKAATTSANINRGNPPASRPLIFQQPPVDGSSGSQPGPAPTGSTAAGPYPGYLTPSGIRDIIAKVKKLSGGTKFLSLTVYPEYARMEVVNATDPRVYDDYTFRDGKAKFDSKGSAVGGKATVDPATINWDAVPALLKEGDTKLNVAHPTTHYIDMDPAGFDVPEIDLHVADDYFSGYLAADFKGTIIRRYPQK
jgi:serine/threonine protein kinase